MGERTPIGREGQTDSLGNTIGRFRARIGTWDERSARAVAGRCTWFCGSVECPEACREQEGRER